MKQMDGGGGGGWQSILPNPSMYVTRMTVNYSNDMNSWRGEAPGGDHFDWGGNASLSPCMHDIAVIVTSWIVEFTLLYFPWSRVTSCAGLHNSTVHSCLTSALGINIVAIVIHHVR